MRNFSAIVLALSALAFASCGGGGKKTVVIMASGKVTVDGTNIQVEPSNSHNEQKVEFSGKSVTLTAKSTEGKTQTYTLAEDGVYLLNLKRDTLTGGQVNYGSEGRANAITEEQLDHLIDSTQQLLRGQNASDEKKAFFVPPFDIKKITDQESARLVGPFNGVPASIDKDASGKPQEIYKFSTNKQKWETLNELMQQKTKI